MDLYFVYSIYAVTILYAIFADKIAYKHSEVRRLPIGTMENMNVLDLFCGCGGLSYGFQQAGYNVLLGIDNWKDALATYALNHGKSKVFCADLTIVEEKMVESVLLDQHINVIIGGPPCQGFSVAGKRQVDDERNTLYKGFVRMVAHFRPQAFVMENVPNILTIGSGVVKTSIIKDFSEVGYHVEAKVLTASDYGVPQNRRRAIFVGLRTGVFDFAIPTIHHKITTEEALSDLPEYSLSEGGCYPSFPLSEYQGEMRQKSDGVYNHEVTLHSEKTVNIISMVPDGGNYKDLPAELQTTRKVHIAWTRLRSDKPSFTIDTGHRHHFHYQWNRVPTVRECARLQSFPDHFVFLGSKTSQYKHVGNAVPPLLAEAIAKRLRKYL